MLYLLLGVIIGAFVAIESITSRIITHFVNYGYCENEAIGEMRRMLKVKYKYYNKFL